jgi:hypothetical protein
MNILKQMDNKELKIYPVKVDRGKLNEISKYPLCDIPSLILIVGRVKAGKSVLLNNLCLRPEFYGNDYQIRIFISPSAYNDAINKHIVDNFDFVFTEYSDELIDELIEMIEKDETPDRYLIVFDDIVGTNAGSRRGKADKITTLSTLYRHIGNKDIEGKLSIIITTQYFKHITPILRNQCSGVYICGEFSKKELAKIAEAYSFFGGGDEEFINLYNMARETPHDILFLNVNSMEARQNHNKILWSHKEHIEKRNKQTN